MAYKWALISATFGLVALLLLHLTPVNSYRPQSPIAVSRDVLKGPGRNNDLARVLRDPSAVLRGPFASSEASASAPTSSSQADLEARRSGDVTGGATILGGPNAVINNPGAILGLDRPNEAVKPPEAQQPASEASPSPPQDESKQRREAPAFGMSDSVHLTMQVIISLLVLGAGLFVILASKAEPAKKHWAYGIVGTVIGFWLK